MVTDFEEFWHDVRIRKFWMNQSEPNIIVVVCNTGIYKTINALETDPNMVAWLKVSDNLSSLQADGKEIFLDIVQMPGNENELYASGDSTVYWSHNMGDTWEIIPGMEQLE